MSTRTPARWIACSLALTAACGSPATSDGTVESVAERVVIVDNPSCKVELRKVDYDQPGAGSDYMELFVDQKGSAANTLADCGISAVVLFLSSSCALPYRTVPLQNVVIPADGYISICDGLGCDVDPGPPDWMDNGAAEFGFLGVTVTQAPILWVSYEGVAKCIPAATSPKQKQLQSETDQSPNLVNISCSESFILVGAGAAVPRKPNPCPSLDGGTGGTGGTAASGGTGGTAASGGTGGTAASGGTGGTAASGGSGGTAASGGTGGTAAGGGTGGAGADAGVGGSGADAGFGGAAGAGADAGVGGSGADAGLGGAAGAGAQGGSGASGGQGATGGTAASGGAAASGGQSGGGPSDAGLGLEDIAIEGGGCGCRVDGRAPLSSWAGWMIGALLLVTRRRSSR